MTLAGHYKKRFFEAGENGDFWKWGKALWILGGMRVGRGKTGFWKNDVKRTMRYRFGGAVVVG
jgi:hypothetical protein